MPLGLGSNHPGKVPKSLDPRVRRPAITDCNLGRGAQKGDVMTVIDLRLSTGLIGRTSLLVLRPSKSGEGMRRHDQPERRVPVGLHTVPPGGFPRR